MNQQKIIEKILMPGVKNVIAVASGKGGVGKSTIAANLSITLAHMGYKTALFDADLYGPSIPLMFGIQHEKPEVIYQEDKKRILPIEKYGVKIMSIGFFILSKKSLIWRGPAASAGLIQLFSNTEWGEIDFLIIDLPPGTGDIQLTCIQKLSLSFVIMVTTPQQVALVDAQKAADMFHTHRFRIPILGVVENMSYFIPEKHPDEKYYLFGSGGGKQLADELNVPLLAQIPLVSDICKLSDTGKPISMSNNKIIQNKFQNITHQLVEKIMTTI